MNATFHQLSTCLIFCLIVSVSWADPSDADKISPKADQSASKTSNTNGQATPSPSDKQVPDVKQALATNVDDVVSGIQAFYANAQDLKAEFEQTYTYTQMGRTQSKSGKVFFKKPSRMRWDYKRPVPQVFVSDGSVLWVYQPTDAQVFKQDLNQSQLPVALTFMSGRGELKSEFDARLIDDEDRTDSYTVQLTPKKSEVNYKSVVLTVRKSDFSVLMSVVVDPVGNENKLVFSRVTQNAGIPDRAFEFQTPKGVRVIEGPAN